MKVYVDRQNMKLLGVEKERPFYTGDIFSSSLTVYFNTDVSNSSVTLSFLLANGRTPRKNLIPDDARTITLSEEKFGQSTWYSYTWELSAKEGLLVTPGPIQMTLTVTTNDVVEQVMFTNNVVRTSRFGANENLVVFGDDPEEIILDFATNIANINASLYKFRYIGEFNSRLQMYQAAFNEIYTNNYSLVSARYYDNVFIFMRSDAEGEEYLLMVDSSLYKYYKLKNDGTMIETDGANLSGFIYLTSASGTLSADQIENVNKNLCYILYNNRVYQKNSSTIDSMTFVNYDLLYSDNVFNAARYTITITISGNTYSYTSSSKLVETYTKDQINSLLNAKIYYNDIVDNVTSDEIRKPLSAKQGKVLKGLITSVESDLSGNYLKKKPDGTNDIISNNKVSTIYLPDFLLGQLLFGGTFNATSAVATLTTNAKSKLGVSSNTITLTNDSTQTTGYASNEGTFFVVETSGTFAGIEFSTGDWLISIGSAWKKVDNTDEVTSVNGQTGNVNVGTYDKPSGGIPASDLAQAVQDALNNANSSLQEHQKIKVLKTDNETNLTPGSSEDIKGDGTINLHKIAKTGTYADLIGKPTLGTAASHNVANEISLNNNDLVTSGQLYVALRDMPVPMVFKGTLGQNATISSLPTASSENNGFTYKVVTAGTYAGLSCAVGDLVVSNGEIWIVIPAGDEAVTEDTWRGIKVNGTLLKDNGITTGDVDFVEGTNVTITTNANNEIIFSATDTTYDNLAVAKNGENVSLITTGDKYKILQSLYHLGAFDSADGKTRQTGYVDWEYLNTLGVNQGGSGNYWYFVIPDSLYNIIHTYDTYVANGGITQQPFSSINTGSVDNAFAFISSGANDSRLCIRKTDSISSASTLRQWIQAVGLVIQYKLSDNLAYSDYPIENESILPLDSNMAQMIRQDVVEALNLIDVKRVNALTPTGNLSFSVDNGIITINGTSGNNYGTYRIGEITLNGTYYISGDLSLYTQVFLFSSDLGYPHNTSFTANGTYEIRLQVEPNTTFNNSKIYPMIVKGSHPYPYEPYHASKHITDEEAMLLKEEYKKSSNLWKHASSITKTGGGYVFDNYINQLKAGTYTFSFVFSGTVSQTQFIVKDVNDNILVNPIYDLVNGLNSITFTINSDSYYISFYGNSAGTYSNIMLNEGSEAEPYSEWNGELVHKKELPTKLSDLNGDSTHRLVTDTEKTLWNNASNTYYIYNGGTIWVDGDRYGVRPNGMYACYPLMGASVSVRVENKLDSSWMYVYSVTITKPFILWLDGNYIKITYFDGSTPVEHSAGFSSSTLNRVGFVATDIGLVKRLNNVEDNISYTKDN